MRRIVSLVAAVSILILGVLAASLYASEPMSKGWHRSYQTSEVTGSVVMNHEGRYLGRVKDFVFDQDGHVTFAIIGFGKYWRVMGEDSVAVPFSALTYDPKGKHLVVDINWEKFQSAPRFSKNELMDRQREEEVYRYFGQQPYWTEEGWSPKGGYREKHRGREER
jgi:sporulation protein YlmC with PRC-barrel domain